MGNDHGKHEGHHHRGHHNDEVNKHTPDKVHQLEAHYKVLTHSRTHESNPALRLSDFEKMFHSCPELGSLLHKHFRKKMDGTNSHEQISQSQFIETAARILELINHTEQQDFYFHLFSSGKSSLDTGEFDQLLEVSQKICFAMADLKITSDGLVETDKRQAIHRSMFGSHSDVSKGDFIYWCGRHMPSLLHDIHPFVCAVLCGDHNSQAGGCSVSPRLQGVLEKKHLLTPATLWALKTYLPHDYTNNIDGRHANISEDETHHHHPHHPQSYNKHSFGDILSDGGWHLLYDSNSQGLSMNSFKHQVLCYSAPTITFLECEGHLYCLGSDVAFRDTTQRWGECESFLLQILPQHRVILAGSGMIYLNTENRASFRGLQVGKDAVTTVLQIDDDFDKVNHYGVQLSLHSIEVWGCGSLRTLEAQHGQKVWEKKEADRLKNRKLKPTGDWKDNPDKDLLDMGGITTEHAQR